MSRRALFTGLAVSALVAAGAVVAPSASAVSANAGCRSTLAGGYANVDGVSMDSCIDYNSGSTISARAIFSGSYVPGGIDVCGHIVDITTHAWVKDFGCPNGWDSGSWNDVNLGSWTVPYGGGSGGDQYVLSVGYWATINGVYGYYGDVESPVFVNP